MSRCDRPSLRDPLTIRLPIDKLFRSRYGKDNRRPRWMSWYRSFGGVFFSLVTLISLAACQQGGLAPVDPTASPSVKPTLEAEPIPIISPSIPECFQRPGEVVEETLTSDLLQRPLAIQVYLPPCYDVEQAIAYPSLYLLHGLGDSYDQWPRLGLLDLADRWVMNQKVQPFVIIMPWEESGQDMVVAVLDVLVPHLEAAYHVRTDPGSRALGGISRGGGWALAIAADDPGAFGAIGLHSTGVLNSFGYLQVKLREPWSTNQPRLWIDVGDGDTLRVRALELLDLFDQLGLSYSWHLNPGDHSDAYWSAHIEEYLDWYIQGWH